MIVPILALALATSPSSDPVPRPTEVVAVLVPRPPAPAGEQTFLRRPGAPVALAPAWTTSPPRPVFPAPPGWVLLPVPRGMREEGAGDGVADSSRYVTTHIGPGDEPIEVETIELVESDEWLRAPIGDNLLVDPGRWRAERHRPGATDLNFDYNRVDQLRLGLSGQLQDPYTMAPRFGGRIEYATGRKRVLYGVQVEQPLAPPGRLALGVSMVRRTDHSELQQVDDLENTLALLLGRQDYHDYFEREGAGAYLSWRVPDFSTVSVHARADEYRSLGVNRGTRSWFQRDRTLRDNPQIDEGTERSAIVRLERLAQTTTRTRAGLYHWIEVERAGAGLGGDFDFTRMFADVRSVLRMTPSTTLSLRAVGGHTVAGSLPRQRQFPLGGVDGLRAHIFSQYLGDQLLLGQAEYDAGLWRMKDPLPAGLHALVFADAGAAWRDPQHRWDLGRQRFEADGGFGFASADDALRIYFAKNLRKLESDFVISMRLQRPF